MRKSLAAVSGLLLLFGVAGSLARVHALESAEVDYLSPSRTLSALAEVRPRHALGRVELHEGQAVIFEVCALGSFAPEAWIGKAAFEVWSTAGPHLLRRTELDAAQVARARPLGEAACMEIARAERLPTEGPHEVTVDWGEGPPPAALADASLAARVQAIGWPVRLDAIVRTATFAGALLLVVALLFPVRSPTSSAPEDAPLGASEPGPSPERGGATVLRVLAGIGALLAAEALLAHLPFAGRTYAFVRGLLLASVQLVAAFALVRPARGVRPGEALGLVRPSRPALWLPVALGLGLALPVLAQLLQSLLPATAESHVASLVVFPSGALAVRVVGSFAPLVEEIFFRGFVYGEVDRRAGPAAAFAVAVVAFAAVHVPQVSGDAGSLAAIFVTGVLLTGLRWGSGTATAPALAHLIYNASL